MRESTVEKYFNKLAKACGGETRKIKFIGRRGAPDRLLLLDNGVLYWIELKRPKKGAEAHQRREHERLAKRGQRVYVLSSLSLIDRFFAGFNGDF